ncbi:MAG: sulfide/dihydroorotate dehydrogenase-like FAD/NAD-binding protein [Endomicrobium sp.]|nr:sulfide/dihydroorotate dehydrogenase-like FAD/NAD-binding protein [Endomicrobium sp.]
MYKILNKQIFCNTIISFEIFAPNIIKNAKAGQFVIIRNLTGGERIPLTIAGINYERKGIKVIFQIVGQSTMKLASLSVGDYITDILGPLGNPTQIRLYGTIVAIAGGIGIAEIVPVLKNFKQIGNKIITLVGVKSKNFIILEHELKQVSDSLLFSTNDGSYGRKGFVTDMLNEILPKVKIDMVYAVGPLLMMKNIAAMTKMKQIKTIVSMNTIMLDGTGMCGSCRLTVHNKTKFVCTDGPEFDAHSINWDEAISRLTTFSNFETIAYNNYKSNKECQCHMKLGMTK